MDQQQSSNPVGRPRLDVNEETIVQLCSIGCTMAEMSQVTGASESTLRANFHGAIKRGRANGAVTLRRTQWQLAMKGDRTMLIWLGKQLLGQTNEPQGSSQTTDALDALFESVEESVETIRERLTLEGSFGSGSASPAPPPMTADAG